MCVVTLIKYQDYIDLPFNLQYLCFVILGQIFHFSRCIYASGLLPLSYLYHIWEAIMFQLKQNQIQNFAPEASFHDWNSQTVGRKNTLL